MAEGIADEVTFGELEGVPLSVASGLCVGEREGAGVDFNVALGVGVDTLFSLVSIIPKKYAIAATTATIKMTRATLTIGELLLGSLATGGITGTCDCTGASTGLGASTTGVAATGCCGCGWGCELFGSIIYLYYARCSKTTISNFLIFFS